MKHRSFLKLRQKWIRALFISKPSYWLGGLLSGLSLFVEAKRRRGELAMYVLPKALESAWVMARGKGYAFGTGDFGERLVRRLLQTLIFLHRLTYFVFTVVRRRDGDGYGM